MANNKNLKRLLSLALCLVMLCGLFPVSAMAEDVLPDNGQNAEQPAEPTTPSDPTAPTDPAEHEHTPKTAYSASTIEGMHTVTITCETCSELNDSYDEEHDYTDGDCACGVKKPADVYPSCEHHTHDANCGGLENNCIFVCSTCVSEIQAMVDALPAMSEINTENRESVISQLKAIDDAKYLISNNARDEIDWTKYADAAVALTTPEGDFRFAVTKKYEAEDGPQATLTFVNAVTNEAVDLISVDGTATVAFAQPVSNGAALEYRLPAGTYTIEETVEGDWDMTLTVNGVEADGATFTGVAGSYYSIVVGNKLPEYGINIETPSNGTVKATVNEIEATVANYSDTVTLTVTPNEGYKLVSLTVKYTDSEGEKSVDTLPPSPGSQDWTFNMPQYAVTVTATFKKPVPESGNIAPSLEEDLTYNGASQNFLDPSNPVSSKYGTFKYFVSPTKVDTLNADDFIDNPVATNAGTYYVYWMIVGNTDYEDVNPNIDHFVEVSIAPATLTNIKVSNYDKTYDGTVDANPNLTLTFDGKIGSDDVDIQITNAYYDKPEAKDNATLSIEYKISGNAASNYILENNTQSSQLKCQPCTIAAKEVSAPDVTLSDGPFTYDGSEHKPTVTVKDGETIIPTSEYEAAYSDNVNAGTATVTITDKVGGNYSFTEVKKTFTIEKAELTITVNTDKISELSLHYGDQTPNLGVYYELDGLVPGDSLDIRLTTDYEQYDDAKNYDVTLSYDPSSNYDVTVVDSDEKPLNQDTQDTQLDGKVSFTIQNALAVLPAPLTITADDKYMSVSDDLPTLTYKVSGLIGSDKLVTNPTLSCMPDTSAAGIYEITASGASAGGNYDISYISGKLYVTAANTSFESKIAINALTTVPEGMPAAFDTVAKIQTELSRASIAALGGQADDTAHYDVKLQFSLDGGKTWIDATENNFPAGGITVVLPYPAGTSSASHNFAVSHMFTVTSERLGTTAGGVETPTVHETAAGIQVTLNGLSPVSLSWVKTDYTVTFNDARHGSVTSSHSTATAGTVVTLTTKARTGYKLNALDVYDAYGDKVNVTAIGGGKYTFVMPASNVSVTARFRVLSPYESPDTGDGANFGLWTALLLLSAAGFAALIPVGKRYKRKSK